MSQSGSIRSLISWRTEQAAKMAQEEACRRNRIIAQLKSATPSDARLLYNDDQLNTLLTEGKVFIGYIPHELYKYGAKNVTDLRRQLRSLRFAWAGTVKVVIQEPDSRIRVWLKADE